MTATTDNGVAARHSSATVEHYTPAHIVEAARTALLGIDLDPFSCAEANEVVQARLYMSERGFDLPWHGRVFVNPPGGKSDGQSNQRRAWFKLMFECAQRRVEAAVFICFSVELLQTTQVNPTGLLPLDFPICFPSRRVAYRKPGGETGGSPPHSSCIIGVPPEIDRGGLEWVRRFATTFAPIGKVIVPAGWSR